VVSAGNNGKNLSREAAEAYRAAGFSIIPIRLDGGKSPALDTWKVFQQRQPTPEEFERMFPPDQARGIALVGGKVSRNVETMDFETTAIYEEWLTLVKAQDESLLAKLVITATPGKYRDAAGTLIPGRHVRYSVEESFKVPGNLKLARDETGKQCLIETRGEGGYSLLPGSPPAAHPNNAEYRNIQGIVSKVQTITEFERNLLIDAARSINRHVEQDVSFQPTTGTSVAGDRPGDKFNAAADWSFLEEAGWKVVSSANGRTCWKRPGKDTPGISATTGVCKGQDGTDRLYVFSTNAEKFEPMKCYSAFSALTMLKYNGNFTEAARAIGEKIEYGPVVVTSTLPEGLQADDEAEDTNEFVTEGGEVVEEIAVAGAAEFPVTALPRALQQYVLEVADSIRCPVDFPGCFVLAVASVGIGNTRKIALKKKWSESARLYMAIVADPGSAKSPAMKQVCEPLFDRQREIHDAHEAAVDAYRRDKEDYEAKKKAKDPTCPAEPPRRPSYEHLWTSDATTEKLADMLKSNPRGLGMMQDEVTALVQGMNQYKQGGKGRDRQFFLSVWDGTPAKVDRKNDDGNPIVIHDPYLSIFGGIQPEMLGSLRDEFGREDGFVHRFLFSFPATGLVDEWRDDHISEEAERAWKGCFAQLMTLKPHREPDGKDRPFAARMNDPARAAWKRWYDETCVEMVDLDPVFQRPMRKMIGYAARLSLIVQMLRWACGETKACDTIEEPAIVYGCQLADYFQSHMQLVYTRLHEKPDDWQAKELLTWIQTRNGKVTVRDVVRNGPSWVRKRSTAVKKLQDLDDRGHGTYGETRKPNGTVTGWFLLKEKGEADEN
jgi:hypothetical protein